MPRRLCRSTKSSVSTPFSMSAARFSRGATLMRISVVTDFPSLKRTVPHRYACATQQLRRLEQRQAHHVGVAARNPLGEHGAETLDGVRARLALRLSARPVRLHLLAPDRAED